MGTNFSSSSLVKSYFSFPLVFFCIFRARKYIEISQIIPKGKAAHIIILLYDNPVIASKVTTGPVNGPHMSPVSPEVWKTAPTVLGVRPTAATTGIRMGAIIEHPPANVPSSPQIRTHENITAKIAFFSLFTPILFIIQVTIV